MGIRFGIIAGSELPNLVGTPQYRRVGATVLVSWRPNTVRCGLGSCLRVRTGKFDVAALCRNNQTNQRPGSVCQVGWAVKMVSLI